MLEKDILGKVIGQLGTAPRFSLRKNKAEGLGERPRSTFRGFISGKRGGKEKFRPPGDGKTIRKKKRVHQQAALK